jgi:acetylornithine deacetylase/succinyl-diaminopimelate desuccinylase-like protein
LNLLAGLEILRRINTQYRRKPPVSWERLMRIEPVPFDSELLDLCAEAIRETCGTVHRMPSGPLHDAAEWHALAFPP